MKIAVVGSRNIVNKNFVFNILDNFIKLDDTIISGEARGVDTLAKQYAIVHKILYVGYPPINNNFKQRNQQIADACDMCLAFPSETSRGTWDTINKCKKLNKHVEIFYEHGTG